MILLGDIHCDLKIAERLCKKYPAQTIVQLGDCGVGFAPLSLFEQLPVNFKFFRGNHDNPALCKQLPHYLGDFGEFSIDNKKIFVVGGADSIDKHLRVEGRDWWADEELDYKQCKACLDAWEASDAEILITHDAPQFLVENYFLIYDRSITRLLLEQIHLIRKPKAHYFGHWHKRFEITSQGTKFRCVNINESIQI